MSGSGNSNPKAHGETPSSDETNYKSQLDLTAERAKNTEGNESGNGGIVEKVSQYVPVVGKLLGKADEPGEPAATTEIPGPPERPQHDPQIQEFVRDQHRSKDVNGVVQ